MNDERVERALNDIEAEVRKMRDYIRDTPRNRRVIGTMGLDRVLMDVDALREFLGVPGRKGRKGFRERIR